MSNFPTLQGTVKDLCNHKVREMGQNLHANMEGLQQSRSQIVLAMYGKNYGS